MALDPQSIARRDFPTTDRGYDPAAVDAHLSAVAQDAEALRARVEAAGSELQKLLAVLSEAADRLSSALAALYADAAVPGGGPAEAPPVLGVTVGQAAAAAADEEVGDEPALAAVEEAREGDASPGQA